ncbi:hypothetical protein N7495_002386 [Penicillium taxi]|uniref:uncharacterized protein n=1 Tax=Penicillium taxi TaxID=168475 RepID=UPI0025456386|nr:uncharacterized protein N7495_002386 [Penicillium taxi]KAJ5901858.1 hypothetical protein N7495_002386 [Penicillium taxi]
MILLVLVWIAILAVALVEFGTYLWNRKQDAIFAAESHECCEDSASICEALIKSPLQQTAAHEGDIMSSSEYESDYDSDSGSESDFEEYQLDERLDI